MLGESWPGSPSVPLQVEAPQPYGLVDGIAPGEGSRCKEDDTPFDMTYLGPDGHRVGQDDGGCDNSPWVHS